MKDLPKTVFVTFNLLMVLLFIYSFLYPEESGNWLTNYGFHIIVLEFLSVFTGAFAIIKEKTLPSLIFLFVPIVLAFMFVATVQPLLFIYFIVSSVVKYFTTSESNAKNRMEGLGKSGLAMILGMVLGALISGLVLHGALIMVWAAIYYSLLILFEFVNIVRPSPNA